MKLDKIRDIMAIVTEKSMELTDLWAETGCEVLLSMHEDLTNAFLKSVSLDIYFQALKSKNEPNWTEADQYILDNTKEKLLGYLVVKKEG